MIRLIKESVFSIFLMYSWSALVSGGPGVAGPSDDAELGRGPEIRTVVKTRDRSKVETKSGACLSPLIAAHPQRPVVLQEADWP